MAKITFTPGSIYLLREKDYLTGEISRYVKIGLVRDDKDTETRILEHQTGNPREIFDHQSLRAPFVEHLETQLHYRFSDKWITGEWFDLNEEEIENVITEARIIISEQEAITETLERSYELAKVIATKGEREPTNEETAIWNRLIEKKLEIDTLKVKQELIIDRIKKVMGNAGGIKGIVKVLLKKGGLYFNEVSFKEKHPDLYEKYLTKKSESISGSFTLKNKISLKNDNPALYEEKKNILKTKIEVSSIDFENNLSRSPELESIHQEYIDLQKIAYVLEWEYDQLEAKLKESVGKYSELTGLCGWNRIIKDKISFDKKTFEEEHEDLFKDFLNEKADNYAISISTSRKYAST
jgi:hypothetical protein|tara:strand:+ start:230 stop:1288 length:1059 start_codon:yes stop_codon:yes gene_type:complete